MAHQTSRYDTLGICVMTMDGRCQPALLRMPHALPAPVDAVGKRVQRRRPVHRRLEPLPDTCAGSGRGRIGGQGGAPHPGVRRAPPLDGPARVQRGLRQAHEAQGLRQTWLALVPARQRCAWRTAMRSAGGAAARRPTGGHGDVAWGAALCAGAPCDPRRVARRGCAPRAGASGARTRRIRQTPPRQAPCTQQPPLEKHSIASNSCSG